MEQIELIKLVGGWLLYPLAVAYISVEVARFHFEKDMKKEYLVAKDKVAREIIGSMSGMILNMWEVVNINNWIATNQVQASDLAVKKRKTDAVNNFHTFTNQSYQQLGQMGLYYGTEIVEEISVLQEEWVDMINTNNFKVFNNWGEYRRTKILPPLNRLHTELKNTVFKKTKSFQLEL